MSNNETVCARPLVVRLTLAVAVAILVGLTAASAHAAETTNRIAVNRIGERDSKTKIEKNSKEKNHGNINSNFQSFINHENPAADLAEQPCSSDAVFGRRTSRSRT